ncbi:MAG: leucine-rich repeat domain-containing protein [archaeon]|nr:leucine-rich repeat domain-containing protein [archaeon]
MFERTNNGDNVARRTALWRTVCMLLVLTIAATAVFALSEADDSDAATYVGQGTYNGKPWVMDSDGNLTYGISASSSVKTYNSWGAVPNISSIKIKFDSSVTSIPEYMFYTNNKVTSVTFGSSITSIGNYAFYGTGLTSVTIPSTVKNIGELAFSNCGKLTSVTINGSPVIDNGSFSGSPGVTVFKGNCPYIYNGTMIVINKMVVSYAAGSPATSVSFPDDVTSIDSGAFTRSPHLVSVDIPDTVTSIGASVFNQCDSIQAISFPAGVKVYNPISNLKFYDKDGIECKPTYSNPYTLEKKLFVKDNDCFREKAAFDKELKDSVAIDIDTAGESVLLRFVAPAKGSYSFFSSGALDTICTLYTGFFSSYTSNDDLSASDYIRNFKVDIALEKGQACYLKVYTYHSYTGHTTVYSAMGAGVKILGNSTFSVLDAYGTLFVAGNDSASMDSHITSWSAAGPKTWDASKVKSIVVCPGIKGIPGHAFEDLYQVTSVTLNDGLGFICENAFDNDDRIVSITVPDSVTFIGTYAFAYMDGLETLTLGKGVKTVPEYLCYNDYSLDKVVLGSGLVTIGRYAFANSGLDSVSIPSGTKTVEDHAFYGCSGLTSITFPVNVTSIGEHVCDGCSSLTTVVIKGPVEVPAYAFANCYHVTSVTLNSSVAKIGDSAFYLNDISSITLYSGLKEIGASAFYGCGLTEVTIPSTVTTVGEQAFNLNPLSSFGLVSTNKYLSVSDGVLYNKDKTTLLAYPMGKTDGTFTVPSSVVTIYNYAFEKSKLTEVDASKVSMIGMGAFINCDRLQKVDIGSAEDVSAIAFRNDDSLREIRFGKDLDWVGTTSFSCKFLDAFDNAIPDGDSDRLRGLTFSGYNGTLKANGVMYGDFLVRFVGTSVIVEGTGTFGISDVQSAPWAPVKDKITGIEFAEGVTGLGVNAVVDLPNLTKVIIPSTVSSIDGEFVDKCPRLAEFTVYNAKYYISVDGILYTKDMKTIVKAPTAYKTSDFALLSTVEKIGDHAFSGIGNTYSLDASGCHLVAIGNGSFEKSRLYNLTLPEGLRTIGDHAFKSCTYMNRINIPSTVDGIADNAFEGFTVKEFYNDTVIDPCGLTGFVGRSYYALGSVMYPISGTNEGFEWYMVDDTLHIDGKGALPGNEFTTGHFAYWSSTVLIAKKVVLSEGITSIGKNAFRGLLLIKEAILPSTVRSIGDHAFDGCNLTADITFPASLTEIGEGAFQIGFYDNRMNVCDKVGDLAGFTFRYDDGKYVRVLKDPCNVTVHLNGQTETIVFEKGSAFDLGIPPVKNLVFRGWYLDSRFTKPLPDGYTVNGNISVYGKLTTILDQGTAGDDIKYYVDSEYALVFVGTGEMYDYDMWLYTPWATHRLYIKEIQFDDRITHIGDDCFGYITSLTSVRLPGSTVSVGYGAFQGCISLERVYIPYGVKTIGAHAFDTCSSLTAIELPASVTDIGSSSFNRCSELPRFDGACPLIVDGKAIVKDGRLLAYVCKTDTATIPAGVTFIDQYSVSGPHIRTIIIPDGVTDIEDLAFFYAEDLLRIDIPESVTSIGTMVFTDDLKVEKITFPSGLKFVSEDVAYGTTFYDEDGNVLPVSAQNMAGHTFVNKGNGTMVLQDHPENVTVTFDIEGFRFSAEVPYGTVPALPGIVPVKSPVDGVPYSFDRWDGYAYMPVYEDTVYTALFSPTWDFTVTIHYDDGTDATVHALYGERLNEPRPVYAYFLDEEKTVYWSPAKPVDDDLVLYASVAVTGTLGDDIEWYLDTGTGTITLTGSGDMPEIAKNTLAPWYGQRSKITGIVITGDITSVAGNAFYGYSKVTDIFIGDNVTSIGKYAFKSCPALETLWVGNGVTEMSALAFTNSFVNPDGSTLKVNAANFAGKQFYRMEDSLCVSGIVGSTGDVTWSIDTYDGVIVFRGNGHMGTYSGPTAVPWYQYRSSIHTVIVEEGVTDLCDFAFYSYPAIYEVRLADSVETLGKNSLRGCNDLFMIEFGKGLATIGSNALYGYTFYDMDGNVLKASASKLAGKTFTGQAKSFYEYADAPTEPPYTLTIYLGNGVYRHTVDGNVSPVVPFKADRCSGEYGYYIPTGVEYTAGQTIRSDIAYYVLYDYVPYGEAIISGTTENGVTWVVNTVDRSLVIYAGQGNVIEDWTSASATPWYAYRGYIDRVVVSQGIERIGNNSFRGLNYLYSVYISDTVTSIGKYAFYHDYAITDMYLGSGIESIGTNAFNGLTFRLNNGAKVDPIALTGASVYGSMKELYCYYMYKMEDGYNWMYVSDTLSVYGDIPDFETTTGAPWSKLKNGITGVQFYGCTHIGARAFYNFSLLTDLVIPDDVIYIGTYAFKGCTAIEHMSFGSGLGKIGSVAFTQSFSKVDGSTVTISAENFANNEFTRIGGKMVLSMTHGTIGEVQWKLDYIDGVLDVYGSGSMGDIGSVKAVPWYQDRGSIVTVIVENGVTDVANYAFYSYGKLKSISMGDTVNRIGINALRGCSEITTICFGSGLADLGSNALYGFTFKDMSGATVKTAAANLAGHDFEGSDKILTMVS